MNNQYSLVLPSNVICGSGVLEKLADIVKDNEISSIAVFVDQGVYGSGAVDSILKRLVSIVSRVTVITDVPPEPEEGQVKEIFEKANYHGIQMIVAIGGGSVIDTAKIVSVMLTNPEYIEKLSDSSLIKNKGICLVAVPTSAGTGAEATPNAIILIPEKKLKVGVVHKYFIPSYVILDPELTRTLPKSITAATGIDAYCHCIETYISRKSNAFSSMFSLEGLRLIKENLIRAYNDGSDMEARECMLRAAFCGGIAIASSSTVAVHALSYPLGGSYRIPHGVSNAILLPYVMSFNMDSIGQKVYPIADALGIDTKGLSSHETGERVTEDIFKLVRQVNIPDGLKGYGIKVTDIECLTRSASGVRRLLDQNPKDMSMDDIKAIYEKLI